MHNTDMGHELWIAALVLSLFDWFTSDYRLAPLVKCTALIPSGRTRDANFTRAVGANTPREKISECLVPENWAPKHKFNYLIVTA